MKFNKKLVYTILVLICIFSLTYNLFLYFIPTHITVWNYLYSAVYGSIFLLGGIIPIYYANIFSIKSGIGKMLLFIGLAMLSTVAGQLIWVYYNVEQKGNISFNALVIADIAFLLFYPLMAIGCFYLVNIYRSLLTKNLLRESIITLIISFIIIFGFFARPDLSSNLTMLEKAVNIFYPIGDVVFLMIAILVVRIGGGKLRESLYAFAFGLLLETTADLLFAYRSAKNLYWNGDIADLLYTVAGLFLCIGLIEIIHSLSQASSNSKTDSVKI